jgi:murein DD-endopeptidase MepM/ murein hydrolase activator NlpD
MRIRAGLLVIAAAMLGWPGPAAVRPQAAGARDVTAPVLNARLQESAVHPGDVGVLVVNAPPAVTAIEGTAFDRPVRFWPAGGGRWHGLVGTALDTPPGRYDVSIRGISPEGEAIRAATTIRVAAKQFETRRLRVANRFVNPPDGEVERILADARRLAAVFADSAPERLWRGPFVPPVGGTATSSFGRLTVLNGQPNGRHQGADFRAAAGTRIVAPNAGRIVLAEDLYFAGNTVVVDHGLGLFSLFAHLSRTDVRLGERVARGDRIGEAGATGRVTGPHVHWAVRMDAFSVDPMSLMSAVENLPEPNEVLSTR